MPHSGMTPQELSVFMSRGQRKHPENEEPTFMRLGRIVERQADLRDAHAAGHAGRAHEHAEGVGPQRGA